MDLISDLEWFGNTAGYLIVVDGLTRADRVVEALAGILPNVVDRWRSQGQLFVVVVHGTSARLVPALAVANERMDLAGALPWAQPGTGSVEVFIHDGDTKLEI